MICAALRLMLGLEEFDGIAGRIVHYHLIAAPTLNDVAAHGYAGFLQFLSKPGKVRHSIWIRFQPPGSGTRPSGIAWLAPPGPPVALT